MGLKSEGLTAIVLDDVKRAALLEKVIRPIARTVEESPYRHRVMSWDLINEPEWAVSGASLYGDPSFTPSRDQVEPVTHEEMERFLKDIIVVLREESGAMITVGAAAFKWAHAWDGLDLDFLQFHMYEWIDEYWPYTEGPESYGLTKPVVMGEYFITNLVRDDPATPSFLEMTESFYETGYTGALGWQFIDTFYRRRPEDLNNLRPFAAAHPCESQFSPAGRLEY
jgi:hypothetical protein